MAILLLAAAILLGLIMIPFGMPGTLVIFAATLCYKLLVPFGAIGETFRRGPFTGLKQPKLGSGVAIGSLRQNTAAGRFRRGCDHGELGSVRRPGEIDHAAGQMGQREGLLAVDFGEIDLPACAAIGKKGDFARIGMPARAFITVHAPRDALRGAAVDRYKPDRGCRRFTF